MKREEKRKEKRGEKRKREKYRKAKEKTRESNFIASGSKLLYNFFFDQAYLEGLLSVVVLLLGLLRAFFVENGLVRFRQLGALQSISVMTFPDAFSPAVRRMIIFAQFETNCLPSSCR